MDRFIRYAVIAIVTFLLLVIATVIVLPVVTNVQRYLPQIEQKLSAVTGRPVTVGADLALGFFPSPSISFSDLYIGNPEGYLSDGLVKIESFEARFKLLPLFKKELRLSRFIIGGLEVNLERRADGRVNWDFSRPGQPGTSADFGSLLAGWSVPKDLAIGLLAVTHGTVHWLDGARHVGHRLDDLLLVVTDFNLDTPVAVEFKASIGGKSLAAEGKIGPIGQKPGHGPLPVELAVGFLDTFSGRIEGRLENLLDNPAYNLRLQVLPFSARELVASFTGDFSAVTNDPSNFRSVGLDIQISGDKDNAVIEQGKIIIDQTMADIFLAVKDLAHPRLQFRLGINRLDLDRYLAVEPAKGAGWESVLPAGKGAGDYLGGQNLDLAGAIQLKELRVGGGTVGDVEISLRGGDGIFAMDSASLALYQGRAQATLAIDFHGEMPETSIEVQAWGIQAKPFLHDFLAWDFLSGSVDTELRLRFAGFGLDALKNSLHADGTLLCRDGRLVGLDLANALKNSERIPSGTTPATQKAYTDFTELKSDFTIGKGVVDSRRTIVKTPVADMTITGIADLIHQQLDLRIEPAGPDLTAGNQDEKQQVGGLAVPFTISGSFFAPKIAIEQQNLPPVDRTGTGKVRINPLEVEDAWR